MDINMLLKQAQNMQSAVEKAQKEVEAMTFEEVSTKDFVKVTATGKKEIKEIKISDNAVQFLSEEKDLFEDILLTTINGALQQAEEAIEKSMQEAGNTAKLPNGFKPPFK